MVFASKQAIEIFSVRFKEEEVPLKDTLIYEGEGHLHQREGELALKLPLFGDNGGRTGLRVVGTQNEVGEDFLKIQMLQRDDNDYPFFPIGKPVVFEGRYAINRAHVTFRRGPVVGEIVSHPSPEKE